MRVKDLRNIKDLRDLKDMSRDDVVELLDELRLITTKSAGDLVTGGRKTARKAVGAPDEGAVPAALIGGIVVGLIVGALFALVFTPFSGTEARRRLTTEAERMRERIPSAPRRGSNGGATWDDTPEALRSPRSGEPVTPGSTAP